MKLLKPSPITNSFPVGQLACTLCIASFEITLGDLQLTAGEKKSMFWRCTSCGEKNTYESGEIFDKVLILQKIYEQQRRDD